MVPSQQDTFEDIIIGMIRSKKSESDDLKPVTKRRVTNEAEIITTDMFLKNVKEQCQAKVEKEKKKKKNTLKKMKKQVEVMTDSSEDESKSYDSKDADEDVQQNESAISNKRKKRKLERVVENLPDSETDEEGTIAQKDIVAKLNNPILASSGRFAGMVTVNYDFASVRNLLG